MTLSTEEAANNSKAKDSSSSKRFHVLGLCLVVLLNCCTPTFAASDTYQVVHTNAHINEPATYHAHLAGDKSAPGPEPLPGITQTTKAVVQRAAPHFEAEAVIDGDFKTVKLSDYAGKYLVLLFYPLDFTFVCPTELIAFGDRVSEFHAIGADVLAVSVDSKYAHLAWTNLPRSQGGLGKVAIPLVSDITKTISKDYGVLVTDGPDAGVSLRALFIISDKGVVRQATMNDLPVGRSVDETLRLVKAFQYTDTHDVVCPAGWEPGSDTMKAHPTHSLSYFQKHGEVKAQ